jgi:hypothetical protein
MNSNIRFLAHNITGVCTKDARSSQCECVSECERSRQIKIDSVYIFLLYRKSFPDTFLPNNVYPGACIFQ